MFYLVIAIAIFFAAAALHVAWCRANKTNALLIAPFLVFSFLGLAVLIFIFVKNPYLLSSENIWHMPLKSSSLLIYILLIPCYVAFYFGTKVKSPTQKLFLLLQKESLSFKELSSRISDREILIPRISDLEQSRCIRFKENSFQLTKYGFTVAKFLDIYQKILGRGIGG